MELVFELEGALGSTQCFIEKGMFVVYFEAYDTNGNSIAPVKLSSDYADEVEAFAAAKIAVGLDDCNAITLEG